ncbi:ferrous iron transport protein A [Marinomonas sp. IMCC 4694]|uniref:FeoA family protein n=1 Tax=Marinomonas sp. IMCC 4694 TaxID=2605432 RepID=UPI0011E7E39D|nr:FeoA family protein [Marinomonas sp. IMCC 4694]TYL48891.1 ferrous iron transport protein A [Marinomonas sp. IMCC 4694]
MVLSELVKGHIATIRQVSHPQADMQQQLLALGFDPGETIQLMTRAPFGRSLQVKVGATLVAIHSDDANHVYLCD